MVSRFRDEAKPPVGLTRTVDVATGIRLPVAHVRDPRDLYRSAVLLSPASVGDGRARRAQQGLTRLPTRTGAREPGRHAPSWRAPRPPFDLEPDSVSALT